ncbi:MAG TPA: LLM class oxidoreductase [Myxococcaceae bacterium]|nr:LLM class oxidoreductase [Myxococcaceae bacterium]
MAALGKRRHPRGMPTFAQHPGLRALFSDGRLTVGLLFPIEAYQGDTPTMLHQDTLARRAEALGFSALWFRDVPLRDPSFGDVGQIYDPFVYLGHVAALTRRVALVTGAIVLPLRHPLHLAKAAASVDQLSRGRFVLGIATGDRPAEALAFGVPIESRAALFRDHLRVLRGAWAAPSRTFPAELAASGLDLVPKPLGGDLPILVVGRSQQSYEWIAREADGFVTYPRPPHLQGGIVREYRTAAEAAGATPRIAQSLYIDLLERKDAPPRPIHLGWALGREPLVDLLEQLRAMGMGHVVLNLKYGSRRAAEVVEELGAEVLPRLAPRDLPVPVPAA